jgi:pimeloyl-ACP methyl ester carboxylesterase
LDSVQINVPFVLTPPSTERPDAPVVVTWHLADPPRTEAGMAAALPLDGLDAWRLYLGLPLHGSRSPGREEYFRRGGEDAVNLLYGPVTDQAVAEFPDALEALRDRVGTGPIALMGGSHGSIVAQQVAVERSDVVAMVLVSPIAQLRPIVHANEKRFGMTYPWNAPAEAIADRFDMVARAGETAAAGPAVRIVVGGDDGPEVQEPAAELRDALAEHDATVDLVTVPGLGHCLADEDERPLPEAARVDRLGVEWLRSHLS